MLETIADSAAVAWPLALTCATVAAAGRLRATRQRERLNRALHELRRPLQGLTLAASASQRVARRDQLALALDALAGLDRAINGGAPIRYRQPVDARLLAEDAVGRWRAAAELVGRRIQLYWHANGTRVICDPGSIARALDNLISNSLEHGAGPISVDGATRAGRLRLRVADGVDAEPRAARTLRPTRLRPPGGLGSRWRSDPRRGHGLRLVADVAAEHGGRFAACRHASGASAVIELPLSPG